MHHDYFEWAPCMETFGFFAKCVLQTSTNLFFFLKKSFWRRFCQAEECEKFFDELQMRSNRFKLTFINTVQESCELYRMILNNCRYENPMNLVNFSLVQKNDEIICTVLLIFRAFRGPKCFDVLLGYKTSWKNWYC